MTERTGSGPKDRRPFTSYTIVDGDHVAYQVAGAGPDLLFLAPMASDHVDAHSGYDPVDAWYRELTAPYRVIRFDRRGLGASDPPSRPITWEDWLDDAVAVLDAAESDVTSVFAGAEAAPLGLLLAATHPRRVRSLVLLNPDVRFGDDERTRARDRLVERDWGRDEVLSCPSP